MGSFVDVPPLLLLLAFRLVLEDFAGALFLGVLFELGAPALYCLFSNSATSFFFALTEILSGMLCICGYCFRRRLARFSPGLLALSSLALIFLPAFFAAVFCILCFLALGWCWACGWD